MALDDVHRLNQLFALPLALAAVGFSAPYRVDESGLGNDGRVDRFFRLGDGGVFRR